MVINFKLGIGAYLGQLDQLGQFIIYNYRFLILDYPCKSVSA